MKKIFTILVAALLVSVATAQTWSTVGKGLTKNGRVESFCEYKGELYVGGNFDSIAGIRAMSIARWNGSTWDSVPGMYPMSRYLSSRPEVEIWAMTVYNGELIAAGTLWQNGNKWVNIAKWNGTTWSQLGNGVDNKIFAMETYKGKLFVTGYFNNAGSVAAKGIASWNGAAWETVGGSGLTSGGSSGNDFRIYKGELYFTGSFNSINGLPVHCIAKWNGTVWDSVGIIRYNNTFRSLEVYDNKLYAGGAANLIGHPSILWIAGWDNITWDSVGPGLNGTPTVMSVYNNELYAAGDFDSAGTNQTLCMARWDGMQWKTVGSGLDLFHINVNKTVIGKDTFISPREHINSMYTYKDELYVGGFFTMIGGIKTNSIAKWHIPDTSVSVNELKNESTFSISPNPFSETTTLNSEHALHNARLVIYNLLGQEIRKLNNLTGQHFAIDRGEIKSGIYFITVSDGEKLWTEKLVVE